MVTRASHFTFWIDEQASISGATLANLSLLLCDTFVILVEFTGVKFGSQYFSGKFGLYKCGWLFSLQDCMYFVYTQHVKWLNGDHILSRNPIIGLCFWCVFGYFRNSDNNDT